MDLYANSLQAAILCTNAGSPIPQQNVGTGSISVSSYSFSNGNLLENSNLQINMNNVNGAGFKSVMISFPNEFGTIAAACSLPAGAACVVYANKSIVVSSDSFTLPLQLTITNLVLPSFTPSTNIYLQTYSSTTFLMDRNTQIVFATTCTLPCRLCNTLTPTICTGCYSNSALVSGQTILSSGACTSLCTTGNYLNTLTSECVPCSINCYTCSAFAVCLSCTGSNFLSDSLCVNPCPYGTYGYNNMCLSCTSSLHCATCSTSYQCITCQSGYYLLNNQCGTDCAALITTKNANTNTCDPCPTNCTQCTGTEVLVTCVACQITYLLDSGRCFLACQTAGLFPYNGVCRGCLTPCLTCSTSITTCTSCDWSSSNRYLHNSQCLSDCPATFYKDTVLYICSACTANCLTCTAVGPYACQSCLTNTYLYQTTCLAVCPDTFFAGSGSCVACQDPCIKCSGLLVCISCKSTLFLYGSTCIDACPDGMSVINGN